MSSRTISLVGIFLCLPSRMTKPCGAVSSVSLSSVRFERSSCTMPMAMFANTTPRNMAFCQVPNTSTKAASTKKSMLKYVKMLDFMICPTVLPGGSMGRLPQPASMRSCACAEERPVSGLVSSTGTWRRSGSSILCFLPIFLITAIVAYPCRKL